MMKFTGAYRVGKDVTPLITTTHPRSGKPLAWARTEGKSRVVYLQLGHDPSAFNDANYRQLVGQSIRWVANKTVRTAADFNRWRFYRPLPIVNGMLDKAEVFDSEWKSDDHAVGIGNQSQVPDKGRSWDGVLDEARVLSVVKDEHWIKLDYESQREAQQFLRFGKVERRIESAQTPSPASTIGE